jgi:hypothetical protein
MKGQIVILDGKETDFAAAAMLMDDDIRERLHADMAPCTAQDFLDAYCRAHLTKYAEPFVVS